MQQDRANIATHKYHQLIPKPGIGYKVVGANGKDIWGHEFKLGTTTVNSGDDGLHMCQLAPYVLSLTHNLVPPLRYLQVSIPIGCTEGKTKDNHPFIFKTDKLHTDKELSNKEWSTVTTGMVVREDPLNHVVHYNRWRTT